MNVEELRAQLEDLPGYLEVCTGRAGTFAEAVDRVSLRTQVRDGLGTGLVGSNVVVIR